MIGGGGGIWQYDGEEKYLRVLVGKAERKRPLSRPGRRWKDCLKLNLK